MKREFFIIIIVSIVLIIVTIIFAFSSKRLTEQRIEEADVAGQRTEEVKTKEQLISEFLENREVFERIIEYVQIAERERIYVQYNFLESEVEFLYGDHPLIKEDLLYLIDSLNYEVIAEITDGEFFEGANIKIIDFLKYASGGIYQGLMCFIRGDFPDDDRYENVIDNWYYYKKRLY